MEGPKLRVLGRNLNKNGRFPARNGHGMLLKLKRLMQGERYFDSAWLRLGLPEAIVMAMPEAARLP